MISIEWYRVLGIFEDLKSFKRRQGARAAAPSGHHSLQPHLCNAMPELMDAAF